MNIRAIARILSLALVIGGVNITLASSEAVASPKAITVTQAKPTDSAVFLSWSSGNKLPGWKYEIEIQNLTNQKAKAITILSSTPSISYKGLNPNTVYSARVHMVMGKFYYPWSKTLKFVTTSSRSDSTDLAPVIDPIKKPTTDPGVTAPLDTTTVINVTSVTTSEITYNSARVTWISSASPKTFLVSVLDSSGLKEINSYQVSGEIRTFVVTGLVGLSTYYVKVTPETTVNTWSTVSAVLFNTPKISVSGFAAAAASTTSINLSWVAVPKASSFEIFRDGNQVISNLSGSATSYTVTGLTSGFSYNFTIRVYAYDGNGNQVASDISPSVSASTYSDGVRVPQNSSQPVIILPYANVPVVGATLTATQGNWVDSSQITSYSYQWQRTLDNGTNWLDLPGQTSTTYQVTASDYNYKLRVAVTARNGNGATTAYSATSSVVDCIYVVQIPVIRGNLVVGQTLEVNEGVWSSKYPFTFTYQWLRNGSNINGELSNLYTLTNSDIGYPISVRVTAITTLGSLSTVSAVRSVVSVMANTDLPVVSGTPRTFSTLTTTNGTWIGNPSGTTYQWQRSLDLVAWDAIPGATSSSYTAVLGDAGYYLRSEVIETKTVSAVDYKVIAASAPTAAVALLVLNISNSVTPAVTGSWTVGQALTVSTGTWNVGGTYVYQWQTSANGSSWTDISGATANSYTLVAGDANNYLRARVTLTNGAATGIAFSNSTAKVGSPYNSVLPVISGTQQVGETLTVSSGTWTGTPTYNYTWQSSTDGISWSTIVSSAANTWVATYALANSKIRAIVSAGNGLDTPTVASTFVAGFAPPRATVVPVVTGTTSVGQVLTSSTGTWPNTSTGYGYQWQRSSDNGISWSNIPSAISSTYTIVSGDLGYVIRSQVAVTTNSGTSAAYSLQTGVVA